MQYCFMKSPIGVFDSGIGGLTVLRELQVVLPEYDFLYLGDNARTPYGTRSFEVVLEFTWQAVQYLFEQGCELVILACNTASAKALRTIQQKLIPLKHPNKRVLGVIRPSAEEITSYTKTNHVGLFATAGTVKSKSYFFELKKLAPKVTLYQEDCPMWVPLIECQETNSEGGEFFFQKHMQQLFEQSSTIDTILLACTHYPIVKEKLQKLAPKDVKIISQGSIVAKSLKDYLIRHPEIESKCSKNKKTSYLTTENPKDFNEKAQSIIGLNVESKQIVLRA